MNFCNLLKHDIIQLKIHIKQVIEKKGTIMKKIYIILFIIFSLYPINADNSDDVITNKKKKKLTLFLSEETKIKTGLRDKDDSIVSVIGLAENIPKIENDFDFFIKIKNRNKCFIIGPWFDSELGVRFDYQGSDETTIFLERIYGVVDSGLKIGYDFGRKNLKGSKFTFTIPVSVNFKLNFNENSSLIFPPYTSASLPPEYSPPASFDSYFYFRNYHTSVTFGTSLGFQLNLKMKKQYMRFSLKNYTIVRQEILTGNYYSGYTGIYVENKNILEYKIAPFNFINKTVDIWITFYNQFRFSYDSLDFRLRNKFYLSIEWTGFKYLQLGWKPFQYNNDVRIPPGNIYGAYDQYHQISMEIWIKAGYKNFWFTLSYEPTLYGLDAPEALSDINIDSVKPHYITAGFKYKL